jgi:hypothetical protein
VRRSSSGKFTCVQIQIKVTCHLIWHEVKSFGSSLIVGKTSRKILGVLNAEDDKNTIFRNVGNYTMSSTVTLKRLKLYTKRHRVTFHTTLEFNHTGQLQSLCQSSFARWDGNKTRIRKRPKFVVDHARIRSDVPAAAITLRAKKSLVTIWRHNTSSRPGRQVNSTKIFFSTVISRWQIDKSHRFNQMAPCFAVATTYSNDRQPDGELMPLRKQPISIASLGLTRWKQYRSAILVDATVTGHISLCFAHRYANSNTVPNYTMALSKIELWSYS